ncbi:unnamed protein product, partial [Staurois parvus]
YYTFCKSIHLSILCCYLQVRWNKNLYDQFVRHALCSSRKREARKYLNYEYCKPGVD